MTILGVDVDDTLTVATTKIWKKDAPDVIDLDIANKLLLANKRYGIEVLSNSELKIVLITSRHEEYREVTLQWLQKRLIKHNKLVMRNFRFSTGVFNVDEYLQYKYKACIENNVKYMLDDDEKVVNMLNSYGISSVLVDKNGRFDTAYFKLLKRIR